MKLTREMLHSFIDNSPPEDSAEQILIDLVASAMIKFPQILPELVCKVGNNLSAIIELHFHTFNICEERALYLEAYLDGKMYREETANKPEYIELQKNHATAIKERCRHELYKK